MDKDCRRYGKSTKLLAALILCALFLLNGCASSPGGGGLKVDGECNGVDELGYHPPFSEGDVSDFEFMGFRDCVDYIKNEPSIRSF